MPRKYATPRMPLKSASISPAMLLAKTGQRPARSSNPNTHSKRPTVITPTVGSCIEVNCSTKCFAGAGCSHFSTPASTKTAPTSRSQQSAPPPNQTGRASTFPLQGSDSIRDHDPRVPMGGQAGNAPHPRSSVGACLGGSAEPVGTTEAQLCHWRRIEAGCSW